MIEGPLSPLALARESPSPSRGEGKAERAFDRSPSSGEGEVERNVGPSPLEGEGGARAAGVGGRGGGYDARTLRLAKVQRRAPTEAERRLWALLRAHRLAAFKFRRQQPIGPYIADFVCQAHRLIVEVDGAQHADSAHDAARTAWLEGRGYRVMRFWNNDVLGRPGVVAASIYGALVPSPSHALTGAGPSLSLEGRGAGGPRG